MAAALKLLIFNAVAGLALIAAVVALAAQAPVVTFDAFALAELRIDPTLQLWLLLGFALAFLAKLPGPPVHAWLPDAHTQAPTAGSILLARLLLKTVPTVCSASPACCSPTPCSWSRRGAWRWVRSARSMAGSSAARSTTASG